VTLLPVTISTMTQGAAVQARADPPTRVALDIDTDLSAGQSFVLARQNATAIAMNYYNPTTSIAGSSPAPRRRPYLGQARAQGRVFRLGTLRQPHLGGVQRGATDEPRGRLISVSGEVTSCHIASAVVDPGDAGRAMGSCFVYA
jgi:hypothetical protein